MPFVCVFRILFTAESQTINRLPNLFALSPGLCLSSSHLSIYHAFHGRALCLRHCRPGLLRPCAFHRTYTAPGLSWNRSAPSTQAQQQQRLVCSSHIRAGTCIAPRVCCRELLRETKHHGVVALRNRRAGLASNKSHTNEYENILRCLYLGFCHPSLIKAGTYEC